MRHHPPQICREQTDCRTLHRRVTRGAPGRGHPAGRKWNEVRRLAALPASLPSQGMVAPEGEMRGASDDLPLLVAAHPGYEVVGCPASKHGRRVSQAACLDAATTIAGARLRRALAPLRGDWPRLRLDCCGGPRDELVGYPLPLGVTSQRWRQRRPRQRRQSRPP